MEMKTTKWKWLKRILCSIFVLGVMLYFGSMLVQSTICRGGEWYGERNDHFDGERFSNQDPVEVHSFWRFLEWRWNRHQEEYPTVLENKDKPNLAPHVGPRQCEVTMINHSSLLFRFEQLNMVVDPVYSDRVSPVSWLGPMRYRPVGIAWDSLPKVDVVLITHDHYDHLDLPTLKRLYDRDKPHFIVPLGNKVLLESVGISNISEMDWWGSMPLAGGKLTMTPAKHYSARYRTNEVWNKTLWGGFYFESAAGVKLYIAGDTAWTKHFEEIRQRLGAPDVAILSVGAYRPYDLISAVHLRPEQSVRAHQVLGAKRSVGCHFGTWQLADDGYQEVLDDLSKGLKQYNVSEDEFLAPDNGKTLLFDF